MKFNILVGSMAAVSAFQCDPSKIYAEWWLDNDCTEPDDNLNEMLNNSIPENVYHVFDGECRYVQGTIMANPHVNDGDYSTMITCNEERFLEMLFEGEECIGSNFMR